MIKEFLANHIAGKLFDKIIKKIADTDFVLDSTTKDIENALIQHASFAINWAKEVSFRDTDKKREIQNIYIELDLYVRPISDRIERDEQIDKTRLNDVILEAERHIALLGHPGAGKTTSMKMLCYNILSKDDFLESFNYPFIIRLREINKYSVFDMEEIIETLYDKILDELGVTLKNKTDKDKNVNTTENKRIIQVIKEKVVISILEELCPVLILDGFDEIPNSSLKDVVILQIQKLTNILENTLLIVTSRSSDFPYSLDNTDVYEICPLNDKQIESFSQKWLENEGISKKFLDEIKTTPYYDTTVRPLTIAHLCAIYARLGKIPDKPKTLYRKIVDLLIEDWDAQQDIKRASDYAKFEPDRKRDFLNRLAYELSDLTQKTYFDIDNLLNIYLKIYQDFGLKKSDLKKVVRELETHHGLFIKSGANSYEFSHASLQEFLTASYIYGLPQIPNNSDWINRFPYELAIAVSISSNPSQYFVFLIKERFLFNELNYLFLRSFIGRLILEKPDFNTTDEVVAMHIVLYSLFIETGLVAGNQVNKHVDIDSLHHNYLNVIKSLVTKNNIKWINNSYSIYSEIKNPMSQVICQLEHKNKDYNYPMDDFFDIEEFEIDLPGTLYCPKDLL